MTLAGLVSSDGAVNREKLTLSKWDIGAGSWYWADTFEAMAQLPDGSVDMILCDLPYGTTQNKGDAVIPFEPLWREYWRVCKPNAAIVLTAAQPFASALLMSQPDKFRYQWVWEKTAGTGFLNAKKAPLRCHELALVFSQKQPDYFPIKTAGHTIKRVNAAYASHGDNYNKVASVRAPYESTERFPRDVLKFPKDNRIGRPHPTQKPVALFEYLIKTYTLPYDLVLDNTAGSGTTAIAAEQTGRRWVCIERELDYSLAAMDRITRHIETRAAA